MGGKHQPGALSARTLRNPAILAMSLALVFSVTLGHPAQAQTYTVIHNFTGGSDGAYPYAGLIIDSRGNLYGTTNAGGRGSCAPQNGCGTVFKLTHSGSGWVFTPIYSFLGGSDGGGPYGRVVFGPNGTLYGATVGGGSMNCLSGCGTVFNLRPPPTTCRTVLCPWTETVLYRFTGAPDAYYPTGDLIFDQAGALYGTTYVGGTVGPGTVWKLTPSGGGWTESVIYSLTGGDDGGNPYGGVVFDNNGNLYCSAVAGGSGNNGAVFQLTPSGTGWTEHTVHDFQLTDGSGPQAGLIFASGALYGATVNGPNNGGTVYQLTPSGGSWTLNTLYGFPNQQGPYAKLAMDAAGNLYGTKQATGSGDFGTVFKLTPTGGGWTQTVLHTFTGGSDGNNPLSSLVFDANGNIYGTTLLGGASGFGVVFQITP